MGNGASIDVLREAEAGSSDLLIAVTNSDEVNLLTALIADKLGCRSTVARVRNQEYDKEMNLLKSSFVSPSPSIRKKPVQRRSSGCSNFPPS